MVLTAALAASLLLATAEGASAALPGAGNGQIAFVSDRDPLGSGNAQVFVMGPAGENPTNVSTNPDNDADPSFSPDGTRIVFSGDPDTGNEDIYVMNADGTNRTRLTTSESEETDPVFSPDGKRIAFVSFTDGSRGSEIHLMDADGGNRAPLLFPPAGVFQSYLDPTWSPDGSRIAYARGGDEGSNIWVLDLASGVQTQLTSGVEVKSEPDWSPDGARIAYVSDPFVIGPTSIFSNPDIWAVGPDRIGNVRLTTHRWADTAPAFSPDASQIAFTRRRPNTDLHEIVNFPGDIHVMGADGSNQRALLADSDTQLISEEEAGDEEPSWQPLGRGADRVDPRFGGTIVVPPVVPILSEPTRAVSSAARRRAGAVIRFRLSERASAKLAVESSRRGIRRVRGRRIRCVPTRRRVPRRKRCTVRKLHGWIVRRAGRGGNRIRFTGRLGRRALKPGRYRIRAGALDRIANPARQRRSRTFRVVR